MLSELSSPKPRTKKSRAYRPHERPMPVFKWFSDQGSLPSSPSSFGKTDPSVGDEKNRLEAASVFITKLNNRGTAIYESSGVAG